MSKDITVNSNHNDGTVMLTGNGEDGLTSRDRFFLKLTSDRIKQQVESRMNSLFVVVAGEGIFLDKEELKEVYDLLIEREQATSKTYQLNTIESTKDKQLFFYINEIIEAIKNNKSITLVLSDSDIQTNKEV